MKKKFVKTAAAVGLCVSLLAMVVPASAESMETDAQRWIPRQQQQQISTAPGQPGGQGFGQPGGRMVINEPGEYTLTGDMRGTVYVDPGAGNVKLILDGARIDGANGPAIMAVSGDRLDIEVRDGSSNGLNGGPDGQFGGAVYSEIPVSFEGGGRLDMMSKGPDAVRAENNGVSFNFAPGADISMNGAAFNGESAPGKIAQNGAAQSSTDTVGEIVAGTTENSAMTLTADMENATTIVITDESDAVKISDSGTYIVTGSSSDGSITVKKETTGVVLVLDNLDLTSTSGAALSVNKNAEVQIVVSGNVTLTDAENPADEDSADEAVADAYDGAAIKVKAGSTVYITGNGTLTVNGDAKNGIKAGDDSSLIIGGEDLSVNITAVNDGINGNYDVTVLSGGVTISAGDDGIHADHILTVGTDGTGPDLTVTDSTEGLEGTVVNIAGGKINVTASDDGINAANGDGAYSGELGYSINVTGGDVTVNAGTDGFDSNGNINLVGGSATIHSDNNGGDAGLDYDSELYISDSFDLNNASGVAGPDGMGGMPGQMEGMNGMNSRMGGAPGQDNMGSFGNPGGNGGFGGGMGQQGGPAGGFGSMR